MMAFICASQVELINASCAEVLKCLIVKLPSSTPQHLNISTVLFNTSTGSIQ